MLGEKQKKRKPVSTLDIQQKALERHTKTVAAGKFRDDLAAKLSQGDIAYRAAAQDAEVRPAGRFAPYHGIPSGRAFALKQQARALAQAEATEERPERGTSEDAPEGAKSALLTPAKSQSQKRAVIDEESGEIQGFTLNKSRMEFEADFDPATARLESFALQGAAREILKAITKEGKEGAQVPRYRVCNCLRNAASGSGGVSILQSVAVDSVRFGGLQTCGSVWHCKICATRVSEVRKLEVRHAVDTWLEQGHGVLFVTNTFPHGCADDLRVLLSKLLDVAWNRYINHRQYKKVREALGYIGRIRALEVTHGEANGWHPHLHEIWFIEKPLNKTAMKLLETALFKVWKVTALGAGFNAPSRKYGVNVQGAESAADYIAKFGTEPRWEVGKEMAKAHVKKSRDAKGKTPFDLLRSFAESGCKYSASLFREYAIAFAGKVQLYWSQGLKGIFRIEEISDEQIADKQDDDAIVLAQISWEDWRNVLRSADRGILLELARGGGAVAVDRYLACLRVRFHKPAPVAVVDECPF